MGPRPRDRTRTCSLSGLRLLGGMSEKLPVERPWIEVCKSEISKISIMAFENEGTSVTVGERRHEAARGNTDGLGV